MKGNNKEFRWGIIGTGGIANAFVSASTIEAIYLISYSKFKSVVNNE